jgi:hypothetical protein
MLLFCRHIRVLIATPDKCYEKNISSAEQGDFATITEQEGLPGGSQQERKHHLLRLQKITQVSACFASSRGVGELNTCGSSSQHCQHALGGSEPCIPLACAYAYASGSQQYMFQHHMHACRQLAGDTGLDSSLLHNGVQP